MCNDLNDIINFWNCKCRENECSILVRFHNST